jgi:hypothetical protein
LNDIQIATTKKLIKFEARPLVIWTRANLQCEWCVWVERRKYDDGSVTTDYQQSEDPNG